MKIKFKKRLKNFLKKSIPLWLVAVIVIDTSLFIGIAEYYLMKNKIDRQVAQLAETTRSSDELVQIFKQQVLPANGYKTAILWKDLGKQLVESGVIDQEKYQESFSSEADGSDHLKYLEGNWDEPMVINEKNSRFMVDTLWALALVNKSKVLDEGPLKTEGDTGNFASTGGWTLGSQPPMAVYSSREVIPLTQQQQDLVKEIAENVFRSCCPNSTAFPDCNHGMAALGYIQLGVKANLSKEQIYKDLLAFNSFWFPQNYVEMAVYFDKQGVGWDKVDPKTALSKDYSSSTGADRIQQEIEDVMGVNKPQSGCAA